MLEAKDFIPSIENFIESLIYTRHLDELDMWARIALFAEQKANRLRSLDNSRNQ